MLRVDRIASADVVRRPYLPAQLLTPAQAVWREQSATVNIINSNRFFGERSERLVFVCCGRNVSYGRALRCLESIYEQRGADSSNVGVVVVDDASDESPAPLFDVRRVSQSLIIIFYEKKSELSPVSHCCCVPLAVAYFRGACRTSIPESASGACRPQTM